VSARAGEAPAGRIFRRGFATTFGLDIATRALSAVTVVVLIRSLSVSAYAYVTLLLTFAQLFGSAATSGVRTRYLRDEAERFSRSGPRGTGLLLAPLLKTVALVGILGLIGAPIASRLGLASARHASSSALVLYAAGYAVGYGAAELAIAHFQARLRFFAAGVISVARAGALLIAALVIATTDGSPRTIALLLVAATLVVGVTTTVPLANISGAGRALARHAVGFTREELWLTLYYVAASGFAYVDLLVAGALLSEYQVATLGAAVRYLAIVLGAVPALGAILRVRTSQADIVDSPAAQVQMMLRWLRQGVIPAIVVTGAAAGAAALVIPQIDGGKYPTSIPTFQVFLVTAVSAYLTAPAANVLMAQRRYVTLAGIYGTALLVNLVGDIAVARAFGVVSIAVVSSSTYIGIDVAMLMSGLRYANARRSNE